MMPAIRILTSLCLLTLVQLSIPTTLADSRIAVLVRVPDSTQTDHTAGEFEETERMLQEKLLHLIAQTHVEPEEKEEAGVTFLCTPLTVSDENRQTKETSPALKLCTSNLLSDAHAENILDRFSGKEKASNDSQAAPYDIEDSHPVSLGFLPAWLSQSVNILSAILLAPLHSVSLVSSSAPLTFSLRKNLLRTLSSENDTENDGILWTPDSAETTDTQPSIDSSPFYPDDDAMNLKKKRPGQAGCSLFNEVDRWFAAIDEWMLLLGSQQQLLLEKYQSRQASAPGKQPLFQLILADSPYGEPVYDSACKESPTQKIYPVTASKNQPELLSMPVTEPDLIQVYMLRGGMSPEQSLLTAIVTGNLADVQQHIESGQFRVDHRFRFGDATPLHLAVNGNHIEIVRFLLERGGIDLRDRDGKNETAFNIALKRGYAEIVSLLLAYPRFFMPRSKLIEMYFHAIQKNHHKLVRVLLEDRHVKITDTMEGGMMTGLHAAAYLGLEKIITVLLDQQDLDLNARDSSGDTALDVALNHRHMQAAWQIFSARRDFSEALRGQPSYMEQLFFNAIVHGCPEIVTAMIEGGYIDIFHTVERRNHGTALHFAAYHNRTDIIEYLLSCPGGRSLISVRTSDGKTPFQEALNQDNTRAAYLLLPEKPTPEEQTKINLLMFNAAVLGDTETTMKLLDSSKADISSTTLEVKGNILHVAAFYGHNDLVEFLLERHKTYSQTLLDQLDSRLNSPIDLARKKGRTDIYKSLFKAKYGIEPGIDHTVEAQPSTASVLDDLTGQSNYGAARYRIRRNEHSSSDPYRDIRQRETADSPYEQLSTASGAGAAAKTKEKLD